MSLPRRASVCLALPPLVLGLVQLTGGAASAAPDPSRHVLGETHLNRAVVTVVQTATDPSSSSATTTTSSYDTRGHLVLRTAEAVTDGVATARERMEATYDARGSLVSSTDVYDEDADGPMAPTTVVSTTTYDQRGNPVGVVNTIDYTSDGTTDRRVVGSLSNDRRGRMVSWTETDQDDRGVTGVLRYVLTYDVHGNVTSSGVEVYDDRGDLVATSRAESEYDNQSRLVREEASASDESGLRAHQLTVWQYDQHGNLVSGSIETDGDGDGLDEDSSRIVNTYDRAGHLLSSSQVTTDGRSGQISTTVGSYRYDTRGNVVGVQWEDDTDGDGRPEWRTTVEDVYDQRGRLVRDTAVSTRLPAGDVDSTATTDVTYDAKGRVSSVVTVTAYDVGRRSERDTMTTRYAYPDKGTVTYTVEDDRHSDGVVEATYTVTTTVS